EEEGRARRGTWRRRRLRGHVLEKRRGGDPVAEAEKKGGAFTVPPSSFHLRFVFRPGARDAPWPYRSSWNPRCTSAVRRSRWGTRRRGWPTPSASPASRP